MQKRVRHFLRDECGAAATDWLVLSGAAVALTVALLGSVALGPSGLEQRIGTALENRAGLQSAATPYRYRAMTEDGSWHDGTWWNSVNGRREQMAQHSDANLLQEWSHFGLHYFEIALERGDNRTCEGCRGAGNRLDLMRIALDEMVIRGLDTPQDHAAMADASRRYDASFGQ